MPNSIYFPTLEISLSALTRNYAMLRGKMKSGRCSAVVKANAYGLGIAPIAEALFTAGCRDFFVATLDEAITLRKALDESIEPHMLLAEPAIYVFHGVRGSEAKDFTHHRLTPVLNNASQIAAWNNAAPAVLHIDTGMCRLGIMPDEIGADYVRNGNWCMVMSHLACAGNPDHPQNRQQQQLFSELVKHFPGIPTSFANSGGMFMGDEYRFDIGRPGAALYGICRNKANIEHIENVVTLSAPVLQYHHIAKPTKVGYAAAGEAQSGAVLATIELGYADGMLRTLSNKASGYVGDVRVPIVGHVSMDMIIVDVSAVAEAQRTPDMRVTFIGKQQCINQLAEAAGTIGYEIFTRLGSRVRRSYS